MTVDEAKRRISEAFRRLLPGAPAPSLDILPKALTAGKLYEAYVLALLAEKLVHDEHYTLRLVNSHYLCLKSSPGPINRRYPRIEVLRGEQRVAEIWTDVEFLSLSSSYRPLGTAATRSDYHELDILVVDPDLSGRPRHDEIWLAVECKNTEYSKELLKQILGIRRELSLLNDDRDTRFTAWPRATVPAEPPSCLMVYSTRSRSLSFITSYQLIPTGDCDEPKGRASYCDGCRGDGRHHRRPRARRRYWRRAHPRRPGSQRGG